MPRNRARLLLGAGLIAMDGTGHAAAPFNTDGMFRGWITPEGELSVATHKEVFALGQA